MAEPTYLGRYKILGTLGHGAMGVVYDALDERLGRRVAIKTILKANLVEREDADEYSRRFMVEARAAARVNHPNIVQIFDFSEENDIAYIVMEFISGRELRKYFDESHAFPLHESVRITCELLAALAHAHSKGIVHRDVKPANVMLDESMSVKLADFGVARFSDSGGEKSRAGTMVGTPNYMSPEQILDQAVGPKADVFAVGIILYELLTGQRPFAGKGAFETQERIVTEDPPAPSHVNGDIPPIFDDILANAMAKNPALRLDAATFRAQLIAAVEGMSDDATHLVPNPRRPLFDTVPPVSGITAGGSVDSEAERVFWGEVRNSQDPEELSLFLHKFPTSIRADLVKLRLNRLRGEASRSLGPSPARSADGATTRTGIASVVERPAQEELGNAPRDTAAEPDVPGEVDDRRSEIEVEGKVARESPGPTTKPEGWRAAEDDPAGLKAAPEFHREVEKEAAQLRTDAGAAPASQAAASESAAERGPDAAGVALGDYSGPADVSVEPSASAPVARGSADGLAIGMAAPAGALGSSAPARSSAPASSATRTPSGERRDPLAPNYPQRAIESAQGTSLPMSAKRRMVSLTAVVALVCAIVGTWWIYPKQNHPEGIRDKGAPTAKAPEADVAATRKAEEDAAIRRSEADARRKADDESARKRAEAATALKAEEEAARRRGEAEAKRKAEDEQARAIAETDAIRKAQEEAARSRNAVEKKRSTAADTAHPPARSRAKVTAKAESTRQPSDAASSHAGSESGASADAKGKARQPLTDEAVRQRVQAGAKLKGREKTKPGGLASD